VFLVHCHIAAAAVLGQRYNVLDLASVFVGPQLYTKDSWSGFRVFLIHQVESSRARGNPHSGIFVIPSFSIHSPLTGECVETVYMGGFFQHVLCSGASCSLCDRYGAAMDLNQGGCMAVQM